MIETTITFTKGIDLGNMKNVDGRYEKYNCNGGDLDETAACIPSKK